MAGGDAELRSWCESAMGGELVSWQPVLGGNSRSTYIAAIRAGAESAPLDVVVRTEPGDGPFVGSELTLAREAQTYRALESTAVALPRLLAVSEDGAALILSRMPGSESWSPRVLDDLLAELARLHAIDADRLEMPGFARTSLGDVELWTLIAAERISIESPYLEFALAFLRRHHPGEPERIVLTHGDAGPGNALHDGHRLTALLDWEFAHFGDPIDDLAWITVRASMFGVAVPSFAARVRRHYSDVTGVRLEEQRLRYWQAVVVMRNLVTCLASVSNPVGSRDRLLHHSLIPPLQVMLIDALARLAGVEPSEPEPLDPGPMLPGSDVLAELIAAVPTLVEAIEEEEIRTRGKRMHLLGKQLATTLRLAPAIAAADAAEGPAATQDEQRIQQLSRMARRHIMLFPRSATLATKRFADFENGS